MTLFKKQIVFIDSLQESIFDTLRRSIESNDMVISEYITERQLYDKGIDGSGQPIRDRETGRLGYTRTTIRIKKAKGQPTDRITLRDEKKFHPSITISAYPDRFEVSSNVSYAKYLIKRYGEDIVKPTLENMTEFFNKFFLPELKIRINDQFTR